MTRQNTIIIAVIVVAVAIGGVVAWAYRDQLGTMLGISQEYDTGWIELRNGTAANGDLYEVAQSPGPDGLNYGSPMPNPPFAPSILSRWDCDACTENPGPIYLYLGEGAPEGTFNIELYLNYESGQSEIQAEPLLIEALDQQGGVVSSATVRDEETGECAEDNSGWKLVTTNCSSGGGIPLSLTMVAGGGLRFTATGGSIYVGGVRVHGEVPVADIDLDIPKTVDPAIIGSTDSMNFTFTIQNNGTDPATDVMLYETLADKNLDGQIDMDTSTIGGTPLSSLEQCSGPSPAGGYCFLDLGGETGTPDTLIAYFPTLAAGSSIPVELILEPEVTLGGGGGAAIGFTEDTYINAVGITAAEMNPGNPTYPPSGEADIVEGLNGDGVNDWAWINRTAQVTVGEPTQPGSLLVDKTPATQTKNPGQSAEFTIRVGNDGATATQVFLWDTWVNSDLDGQVDSVDFRLAGETNWVPLGTPNGDYSDCAGSGELAACYVDVDGDGAGDTILVYTDPAGGLGQFPLTDFFSLRFNLKSDAAETTYLNQIGITSKERNLEDPNYPNSFGVAQWNWILDEASLTVEEGITPVENPSASLSKAYTEVGGSGTIDPGDTVEYSLTIVNNGNVDLTNVEIWDYPDTNNLENITITQGTECTGGDNYQCFSIGDLPVPSGGIEQPKVVKYQGTVKAGTTGNDVANQARCRFSELQQIPQGMCEDSATFEVGGIVPPQTNPHANLTKSVGLVSGASDVARYQVGDTVEYTLVVTNDGSDDLTNMTVIDDFDENYMENATITQGTACAGIQQPGKLCFDVGTLVSASGTGDGSNAAILKYTAKIKTNAVGATVTNEADCQSDQFPDTGGGIAETCRATQQIAVEGISPTEPYELYVKETVDKTTAGLGERLNYTTTGGNKGDSGTDNVWFLTSLLIPNQEVVEQAIGELSQSSTIQQVEQVLQQKIGILQQPRTPGEVVQPGGIDQYTNMPGDDYVTGLKPSTIEKDQLLDLDRDGIYDTIVHEQDANWPAGYESVKDLHTNVRSSLNPGTYTVRNTGVVLKPNAGEILTDAVTTTVTVPGQVEPSPVLGLTKLVTDNDETNVTANTAESSEVLTYTVSYTNTQEGSVAREAWLVDDYDESYTAVTDAGGGEDSGNALFWYLGEVAAGQTVTKTFSARIAADMPDEGVTFNNVAVAGAMGVDDVTATVTTTIPAVAGPEPFEPKPYLTNAKVMIDTNGGVVSPGDVLRYTVTINNDGNATATDVEAIDDLPTSLTNLTVESMPTGATDQSSGNKLYVSGFSVAAGESAQIVYTAEVASGLSDGTEIPNGVVAVNNNPTPGTTPAGSRVGSVSGRVGSAFTGPGTGSQTAAQVAGAQTIAQAAETGGNALVIAIITTLLAVGAGIGVVYLRKQLLVTK